ncbi:MAG: CRISPR-associated helicase Cas3' [Parabacteroides sp.]|nr:CRISPR-associated helicase Cas3' [Parabacteroides sp.]
MNDYISFYKNLLGFSPYKYQEQVANLLLAGKNVILSVPTGAGKTWASVMPFLYAKQNGIVDFPQKMIYSLPLRTLTNSIHNDINDLLSNDEIKCKYPLLSDLISIQTGEYCDDPYFEKDIVFSTIDQTLSNFLCFPLAISNNQANINAGSLIGSYLIFDEFHLLDSNLSMSTTIGMLKILKNLCRVCIMTATLTNDFIYFLKEKLPDFEIVSIEYFPQDISKIKSLIPPDNKSIKKAIHIFYTVLNSNEIINKHKNKTIVICNRVETAQRIFLELENIKNKSTTIFCIHSRYFDSDRKTLELSIKKYFGKCSSYQDVILVATQVIEAGMDISCDVMFTEISPVNSFLQRAGRCARFAKESGDIYVCDVLSIEEKDKITTEDASEEDRAEIRRLNNRYLPYDKDLCDKSFNMLKQYNYLDEKTSPILVNEVLCEEEKKKAQVISDNIFNKLIIHKSWTDCDKKHYKEAIRDIQSIDIVLLDINNYQNENIMPWKYETISVYKWSFIGWINRLENEIDSDDWLIAKAESSMDSQFDDEWLDKNRYILRRLVSSELKTYYDTIFVNNKYFNYNKAGFIVANNEDNIISPMRQAQEKENKNIIYNKDTFYQHNKALINCFERNFKPKLKFVFKQLNKYWGNDVDWYKIIILAMCFHDYGKLNELWQKPMLEFQRKKTNDEEYFEILAHTDYNETTDKELEKQCKIKQKPPHAGIGALQVYNILNEEYGEKIARCVAYAILKHHGVKTESFASFSIPEMYLEGIKKLMSENRIECDLIYKDRKRILDDIIPELGKEKEWILYLMIVRILRLCDQKATENKNKYYNL